ncbi:hypothetical protein OAD61_00425 [bacterium]|nr:hypothetical protein [bacterium]
MNTKLSEESRTELQRMIDIGAAHMRKQGCCSTSGGGGICAYRGANGSKCFIGALITDEHYSKSLEGLAVTSSSKDVMKALELSGYRLAPLIGDALLAAQISLHDELEFAKDFPVAFEAALVSYCNEYDLTYTAPGENL